MALRWTWTRRDCVASRGCSRTPASSSRAGAARSSSAARDASLDGDLNTILVKALEKRRERRCAFALELEQDLERKLADEPIRARPPSTIYRLRTFARRHPSLVAAVAIATLGVATGAALAWSGYGRALHAAEVARARQADAEFARLRGGVKDWPWNAHQVLVCLLHEGCWSDVLFASEAHLLELVRQPGQEFMRGLFARERGYALSQLGRQCEALEQVREAETLLRASGALSSEADLQQPIGGLLMALARTAQAVEVLELAYTAALCGSTLRAAPRELLYLESLLSSSGQ